MRTPRIQAQNAWITCLMPGDKLGDHFGPEACPVVVRPHSERFRLYVIPAHAALEVFSAATMLLPAGGAYLWAPEMAANAANFPPGVWALLYATLFHCPISMIYHLVNAVFHGTAGYNPMCTPFRTADLVAIHLSILASL